jgi:hypothetical protein
MFFLEFWRARRRFLQFGQTGQLTTHDRSKLTISNELLSNQSHDQAFSAQGGQSFRFFYRSSQIKNNFRK